MRITFAPDTTHDTLRGVLSRLAQFTVTVTDTDGDTATGCISDSVNEKAWERTPYLLLVRDMAEPDRSPVAEIPYDDIDTVEIL